MTVICMDSWLRRHNALVLAITMSSDPQVRAAARIETIKMVNRQERLALARARTKEKR